jgi:hypothetical protein
MSDLAPSDSHLFGPRRKKYLEPKMKLKFCATLTWRAKTKFFERVMTKMPERRRWYKEVLGEYVEK